MKYPELFSFFEQFVKFSDFEKEALADSFRLREYHKGEQITPIGNTEDYLSFLVSGICRTYYLRGLDDLTLNICFSNSFISAYTSFTQQSPTQVGLEALTPVTVCQISHAALNKLYTMSNEGQRMGRLAAEQMLAEYENRLINLLTKPAAERYQELLRNEPKLLLTIPQKFVAEYLGIQPESLSRIKKLAI